MDCAALLLDHRSSILDESYTVLERSHVHHYEAAGEEFTRARLEGRRQGHGRGNYMRYCEYSQAPLGGRRLPV